MNWKLSAGLLAAISLLATPDIADAAIILTEHFTGVDAGDATKGSQQHNGSTLSYGGHMLTSQLDGATGSQLSYDAARVLAGGLGVGQPAANGPNIGFTRSINNGNANLGAPNESIALNVASGEGVSTIYVANGFSSVASIVNISGFAADPLATSANGTLAYSSGTLTWTITSQGVVNLGGSIGSLGNFTSTLSLAYPAASAGATLVFSNGTDPSEANEYGLRAFETVAVVPEPNALGLLAASMAACIARRCSARSEA